MSLPKSTPQSTLPRSSFAGIYQCQPPAAMLDFTFLLSPAGIFCLMNLVIGTIYITSQLKHQNRASHDQFSGHAPPHLSRPPSLLERVRSINFSSYRPHEDQDAVNSAVNSAPELARPPSFLDRVKSINFSSYFPNEDTQDAVSTSAPQLSRPPSFLERVKSINLSSYSPNEGSQEAVHSSRQLERPPSFLERVKSFKFSSVHHATVDRHEVEEMPDVYVDEQAAAPEKMKKSASEKAMLVAGQEEAEALKHRSGSMTARAAPLAAAEDDDGVDEKANDFINRFRQQLKLQRMDSIIRYREMLNRGASR